MRSLAIGVAVLALAGCAHGPEGPNPKVMYWLNQFSRVQSPVDTYVKTMRDARPTMECETFNGGRTYECRQLGSSSRPVRCEVEPDKSVRCW